MTEEFQAMLQDEEKNYLGCIKSSAIKNFTLKSLQKYGDIEKFIEANAVAEYVDRKLAKNKININGTAEIQWIDLLLSATLLHNLFYDGTLHSIFYAREKLTVLGVKEGLSVETFHKNFGKNIFEVYGAVIEKNLKLGLLENSNGRIFLTPHGMKFGNVVFADFLL